MRRLIVTGSVAVLAAVLCLAVAAPSFATPTTRTITGSDRYETAIMLSKAGFPNGAPAAIVARGDDFADALCGAPLAHAYGGPLLLTPSGGLTTQLVTELQRLRPSHVFVLGLDAKVSGQVAGIVGARNTTSLAGEDRYETAALVAERIRAVTGTPSTVVIVPGDNFPDALAVAPLAAVNNWPILYAPQWDDLPQVTRDEIRSLGVRSALVVGTWARVDLPDVTRKVGSDRYDTCALVAQYALTHGLSSSHVALATGQNFPDGIACGPYLALDRGILLLTKGTTITSPVARFLTQIAADIRVVDAIGLSRVPAGPWTSDTQNSTISSNLQAAINAATPGTTITLQPGTYTGPFQIGRKSNLTIQGPPTAVLTAKGHDVLTILDSSNVVLDGFTLVGDYGSRGQKCVVVGDLNGGAFRNLTVRDAGNTGIYSNGVFTNVTISDCTITHCGDFGIHLLGGFDGVTITRVTASDFAGLQYPSHAVYLKDGRNFVIEDCDLGRAYGPGGGVSAIQVGYSASNGRLLRNLVHDSPFGICLWGYSGSVTTGITCSGNIGRNNSEADFYEYGNAVQATWTEDNVGTFRKVTN